MQLSKRLLTIKDMILPCRCLADIGTDHAFIPIICAKEEKVKTAIASDVREGPLLIARGHIAGHKLEDRIQVRLGDGLSVLDSEEADEILIAGMGGALITQILENGRDKLKACRYLVLSPHTETALVRKAAEDLGFHIEEEAMVRDKGKYYVVIRAAKGEDKKMSDTELKYGPVLIKKRPDIFLEYLKKELKKAEIIRKKLDQEEKTERIQKAFSETEACIEELKSLIFM